MDLAKVVVEDIGNGQKSVAGMVNKSLKLTDEQTEAVYSHLEEISKIIMGDLEKQGKALNVKKVVH